MLASATLRRPIWCGAIVIGVALTGAGISAAQSCVGDCNGDGTVAINELVLGVNIALGADDISACAAFDDGDGPVTVDRLIAAVNNALCGCVCDQTPTPTPSATAGTPVETPTGPSPTVTPTGATPTVTATGATPTVTATGATPTATPTGATATPTGVAETMWTVDNYDIADSDCAGVLEDAVLNGLRDYGSEFTVRRSGSSAEIEDAAGNTYDGTVDPDGTVHVEIVNSDSVVTCDYDVDVNAAADLDQSPTTATYDAAVNLSGFCLGFSDCSMQITARWRRLDVAAVP